MLLLQCVRRAIALVEGDKLIFSIEMEKLWNNERFTEIEDTSIIEDILKKEGHTIDDIDYFAIDGWGGDNAEALAIQPRLKIGEINNRLSALNNGGYYELDIAAYREKKLSDDICEMHYFSGLKINNREVDYISLPHVAGHILSAYFTSPFNKCVRKHKRDKSSKEFRCWDQFTSMLFGQLSGQ